jgi:hypothetical protein
LSCMLCLAWRCVEHISGNTPSAESLLAWSCGEGWAVRLADRSTV